METKQAVLPLSAPVSTSILLCFGNRHNHITVCDETIFVSSMTLYQQAVLRGTILVRRSSLASNVFVYTKPLALQELVGRSPNPLFCLVPMQASHFCKTLFQHSVRVHSHHGSVMFAGIGIASQQAEYARQICNAMRV